jgi:hypothetical protein
LHLFDFIVPLINPNIHPNIQTSIQTSIQTPEQPSQRCLDGCSGVGMDVWALGCMFGGCLDGCSGVGMDVWALDPLVLMNKFIELKHNARAGMRHRQSEG